jgi:hypothetical protein
MYAVLWFMYEVFIARSKFLWIIPVLFILLAGASMKFEWVVKEECEKNNGVLINTVCVSKSAVIELNLKGN